jgi:hypothetical protein
MLSIYLSVRGPERPIYLWNVCLVYKLIQQQTYPGLTSASIYRIYCTCRLTPGQARWPPPV